MTERVRVFRWDGETLYVTGLAIVMGITDVVVGFAAPWWVTAYVIVLSFSLFADNRARYWLERKMEQQGRAGDSRD